MGSDDVVDRLVRGEDGELPEFGSAAYWDAQYREDLQDEPEFDWCVGWPEIGPHVEARLVEYHWLPELKAIFFWEQLAV